MALGYLFYYSLHINYAEIQFDVITFYQLNTFPQVSDRVSTFNSSQLATIKQHLTGRK